MAAAPPTEPPIPTFPKDALATTALTVAERLRAAGFQALFAGGCVRDMVLGLAPKDYDIATDARPEDVLVLFPRAIPVGAAFGVVRVLEGHHEFEIATFRSDFEYVDGRRPTGVRWADARSDAMRRDFTINGLFFDPRAEDGAGVIIDYVDGRADIRRKVIRAIGNPTERFSEDYLRLVRAVRFAARLGFHIEAETFTAIVALAPNIARVSAERTFEEMDKILSHGDAARGVVLLEATGLLAAVVPEVDAVQAERRLLRLVTREDHRRVATWAALLYDLSDDAILAVSLRLKTARVFQREVAEAVASAHRLPAWGSMRVADRKRLARLPTFAIAVEVAESAGIEARSSAAEAAAWGTDALRPVPLVTGDDLRARGHAPGPGFRAALEAVETAQLEGAVTTREAALAVAELRLAGGSEESQ